MKLEYKIEEQDFLDFQLFAASKSDRINKKKRNGWLILTVGSIAITIYFFLKQNDILTIYFGLATLIVGIFYPKYFTWRYKKYYKKHIRENYSKRFDEMELLEFRDDSIYTEDKIGEGRINLSEVEKIDETLNHFFLKISTGQSLIIPKKEIEEITELRQMFLNLGLNVNSDLNWKWK